MLAYKQKRKSNAVKKVAAQVRRKEVQLPTRPKETDKKNQNHSMIERKVVKIHYAIQSSEWKKKKKTRAPLREGHCLRKRGKRHNGVRSRSCSTGRADKAFSKIGCNRPAHTGLGEPSKRERKKLGNSGWQNLTRSALNAHSFGGFEVKKLESVNFESNRALQVGGEREKVRGTV